MGNNTENISSHSENNTLPMLTIKSRSTLPIVQGWMGIGISNWRLAGAVAREWGIWTLSSVGLSATPAYKSLLDMALNLKKAEYGSRLPDDMYHEIFFDTNLLCIKEEIRKAREVSEGKWSLYINVMVAVSDYERQVRKACECGIDGIVSGAWLPLSLPEITKDYPNVALIPILSSLRGVKILLKKWEKFWRMPDAIILEDPSRAWGHLWSASTKKLRDPETMLDVSVTETVAFLKDNNRHIPVIAAGGIVDRDNIDRIVGLGASGVQLGTRFLATHESGASPEFKDAVIHAKYNDIVEYISNAMLPARALKKSGIFHAIENRQAKTRKCVENCLIHCAFRDGIGILPTGESPAQMCILRALAKATEGNPPEAKNQALYFTGTSAIRIKTIQSVHDVMEQLVHPKGEKNTEK